MVIIIPAQHQGVSILLSMLDLSSSQCETKVLLHGAASMALAS